MKRRTYTDEEEIVKLKSGEYRAFVQNSEACQVLNKRLRTYPSEVDFVGERSEGIFNFAATELAFVEAVLAKFPNPL